MKMGTSCYQYELDLQDFSPLQDELLDFSGKDISKPFNAVDAHLPQFNYTVSTGGDKLDWTQFANELAIPTDEEAELEWLSKFIEDSEKCEFLSSTIFQNAASVPSKTRSKRSRSANNSWISTDTPPNEIEMEEKTKNRTRRRDSSSSDVLRCTHCQSEKTPQWRMGPLGPKTLCNACGVRYKSGRLVPEYRPAASPTFVLTQHSNSHRKVMELRKQKEMLRQEGFQVY